MISILLCGGGVERVNIDFVYEFTRAVQLVDFVLIQFQGELPAPISHGLLTQESRQG